MWNPAFPIEDSNRAHAESLHGLLADYKTDLVQNDGHWQVEVELGDLAALLIKLFNTLGVWLDTAQNRIDLAPL